MRTVRFLLLIGLVLVMGLFSFTAAGARENPEALQIQVDGVTLDPDVPPIIEEGRTLVEMRSVFEALGAHLDWDEETRTVTAIKNDLEISLTIDETMALVQDEPHELEVPARLVEGRTIVPVRFVAEYLGALVDWDEATRTVSITTTVKEPEIIPKQEIDELPKTIENWIEYSKTTWLAQEKSYEGNLYILVTYGEQRTGGYVVDIKEVVEHEDEIIVTVQFQDPAEDEGVIFALTYPYDLYVIEDTDKPVKYQAKGAQEYVPILRDIDWLRPIVAESEGIKVFEPAPETAVPATFTVKGVANVFEGTVLYRLLDEAGQELDSGFTSGAMGDWGYFDPAVHIPEQVETGEKLLLELYTKSAKDGSIQDLIEIELEKTAGSAFAPDMEVPENVEAGEDFDVTYSIKNRGSEAGEQEIEGLITADDVLVKEWTETVNLEPGETWTHTETYNADAERFQFELKTDHATNREMLFVTI